MAVLGIVVSRYEGEYVAGTMNGEVCSLHAFGDTPADALRNFADVLDQHRQRLEQAGKKLVPRLVRERARIRDFYPQPEE